MDKKDEQFIRELNLFLYLLGVSFIYIVEKDKLKLEILLKEECEFL